MTAWTRDELDKIAPAEELQLASVRRDGTLRHPLTIWVVRHGDDLYVRSAHDDPMGTKVTLASQFITRFFTEGTSRGFCTPSRS
jgi:Uncharacterized protein conserved in bacteria (DUF2255)